MRNQSSGVVVLLSGGLDSTVLLHYVTRTLGRTPVHALSYAYGQRHACELECAHWQAEAARVDRHRVIDAAFFGSLVEGASALVAGGAPVPDLDALDEAQRSQPPTYVPNRNMILLSVAAAYAEAHGFTDLFYGAQAQDEYGYWDCTTAFLDGINAVLALNRGNPVTVHAPFAAMTKAGIVKVGVELAVDFAHTWSCYRGGPHPCGTCPTCIARLNAFAQAGTPDPLIYENNA